MIFNRGGRRRSGWAASRSKMLLVLGYVKEGIGCIGHSAGHKRVTGSKRGFRARQITVAIFDSPLGSHVDCLGGRYFSPDILDAAGSRVVQLSVKPPLAILIAPEPPRARCFLVAGSARSTVRLSLKSVRSALMRELLNEQSSKLGRRRRPRALFCLARS